MTGPLWTPFHLRLVSARLPGPQRGAARGDFVFASDRSHFCTGLRRPLPRSQARLSGSRQPHDAATAAGRRFNRPEGAASPACHEVVPPWPNTHESRRCRPGRGQGRAGARAGPGPGQGQSRPASRVARTAPGVQPGSVGSGRTGLHGLPRPARLSSCETHEPGPWLPLTGAGLGVPSRQREPKP